MPPGKAWREAFYAMRDEEDKAALSMVEQVLQSNKGEASHASDDYRDGGQQNGWSLLHQAASLHQVKCVEILLKTIKASSIDATTHAGQTPLHLAAQRDDVEVCEKLVLAGADMTLKNKKGYAPWRQAQRHGSDEAVAYLQAAQTAKEKFGCVAVGWQESGTTLSCLQHLACSSRSPRPQTPGLTPRPRPTLPVLLLYARFVPLGTTRIRFRTHGASLRRKRQRR